MSTVITVETCHRNTTVAEDAEWKSSIASSLRRVANKAAQTARFYTTCHGDSYWQDQQKRAAAGATHAELAEWISISSVS